ncbi:hypothetical protein RD792_000053 [Penstemon davidsonii]|uniref:Homeobox domain-containing protein n=1 Tax=Penstemon davidsonii TaxID=160366 RepID=A0ABR0DUK1_9LAMI|nr:hypothetical protein RD792_000053 [Penstemon davidsonii]
MSLMVVVNFWPVAQMEPKMHYFALCATATATSIRGLKWNSIERITLKAICSKARSLLQQPPPQLQHDQNPTMHLTTPSEEDERLENAHKPQVQTVGEEVRILRKMMTKEQRRSLRLVAETNNWKMFREYPKQEVIRICSMIGITRTSMKTWISYNRRKRAATTKVTTATTEAELEIGRN